ncbi:MAG: hypothetical protein L0212_08055, partial [Acidobacteria bacterium]|nr:hypothetical protein [Acidobacteriota bacterium]
LRDSNRGIVGYLANGASAFIVSAVADRVVRGSGGPALIGGMVMTVGRIVEDALGRKLVEFGSLSDIGFDFGLGGLRGEYLPSSFVVPTQSLAPVMAPALMPAANAGVGQWGSPWPN